MRQLGMDSVRVIALTKVWTTGFWMRNWWIPWQVSSLPRVILENRCLRLGWRNEEETRLHCLRKSVSSPPAAITLSMISCGSSTDFVIHWQLHKKPMGWISTVTVTVTFFKWDDANSLQFSSQFHFISDVLTVRSVDPWDHQVIFLIVSDHTAVGRAAARIIWISAQK